MILDFRFLDQKYIRIGALEGIVKAFFQNGPQAVYIPGNDSKLFSVQIYPPN